MTLDSGISLSDQVSWLWLQNRKSQELLSLITVIFEKRPQSCQHHPPAIV